MLIVHNVGIFLFRLRIYSDQNEATEHADSLSHKLSRYVNDFDF